MNIFKKNLNYEGVLNLIVQTGYERYYFINKELKSQFEYHESYFYLVWQIVNCFIFQRMLKYQNIIFNDKDVFKDICDLIITPIQSDYKDDIDLAYIQIKNDILEIWKNDNDDNSHNELNKTANYLVNEILDCEDDDNLDLKMCFSNILINSHFENKKIIKQFKVQIN